MLLACSRKTKRMSFDGHTGSSAEDYEDQYQEYGFGVRNKKRQRTPAFSEAIYLKVGHALIKKRESHLVTSASGPCSSLPSR